MSVPIDLSAYWPIENLEDCFAQEDYYQRISHPAARELEKQLAKLEGARYALSFSWGMSAIQTLTFGLLRSGDALIINEDLYSGSSCFFRRYLSKFGIIIETVDLRNLANLETILSRVPSPGLIFLESPSNPRLWLADIEAIAKIAQARKFKVVVDNTFCTPLLQNPLTLGADLVVYSTTKHIAGHGNSGGGAILFDNQDLLVPLKVARTSFGSIQKPWDAWLHLEGLKTLEVRLARQLTNAKELAARLEKHPKIKVVHHPSLDSFPQKELAFIQMEDGGTIMAFYIKGGLRAAKNFVAALKVIVPSTSTGSYKSLIQIPYLSANRLDRHLLTPLPKNLIRFSVGIENVEELWGDLDQALLCQDYCKKKKYFKIKTEL